MSNFDWNLIFRESLEINDSVDFQKALIKRCKAHVCSVRYVSPLFNSDRGLRYDFLSYITEEELRRYLESNVKKRIYYTSLIGDKCFAPSTLWRVLGRDFPEETQKVKAIIVGLDTHLFEELSKYDYFILVRKPSQENVITPSLNSEADLYTIQRKEFFNKGKEEFNCPIKRANYTEWIKAPEVSNEFLDLLVNSAAYHIFGDTSISYISIPIPLRNRPDERINDFFSIELFWCGVPIEASINAILESIGFSFIVAPEIVFPSDINSSFEWAKHLAKLAFIRQSPVHKCEEWLLNCSEFLQKNACELFFMDDQLSEERVCAAKNFNFYCGLKKIDGLSDSEIKSNLNLDTLFTIAVLHMFLYQKTKVNINTDRKHKLSISDINIDYEKWSSFLSHFDKSENEHGDKIVYIELQNDRLNIFVSQVGTLKNLMRKIFYICNNPDINRHQVASSFYEAFLKLNSPKVNNNKVEFDSIFINLKLDKCNVQSGDKEGASFIIEIDDYNKHISLIFVNQ